ncbi:MAG: hypothetical protein ACLU84_05335 [Clostridia bacterium]
MDTLLSGIIVHVKEMSELPEALQEFLSYDDQGISGLDFMLKDANLAKRIPKNVRVEYEALYGTLSYNLQSEIDKLREALAQLEENPKPLIHDIIQHLYEEKAQ